LTGREASDPRSVYPELVELVRSSVESALDEVLQMREREGSTLDAELRRHLAQVLDWTGSIRAVAGNLASDYRLRLEARVKELVPEGVVDEQRLAQEVALMAERSDISEELAPGWLEEGNEVGKRMDFLLQEMQREANTILSKTGNLDVTRAGIAIKAAIEKLREQAQNVE
jgi:uncharacterized protein (TIGR00255 family)